MIYSRMIRTRIEEALEDTPVVLLSGARQVGKSTLAQHIAEKHGFDYISFDDPEVLAAAIYDSKGFIANLATPVVIDEVQRVPEVLLSIKREVDKKRTPGRFLLTGSANMMTLPKVADSLAGRIEIVNLWPLSLREIYPSLGSFIDVAFAEQFTSNLSVTAINEQQIAELIVQGGYPSVIERPNPKRKQRWFQSYVDTLLQRDVRDISQIAHVEQLDALLRLLAARVGSLSNFADWSREIMFPQTSLQRYVSLLKMIYLMHELSAWSSNLGRRIIKSPKVYLLDTGLATSLVGLDVDGLLRRKPILGHFLENFVLNELRKQATWSETDVRFYHYRTTKNVEVDIILESPTGELVGIEVKAAQSVSAKDFKGLIDIRGQRPEHFKRGIIFYLGERIVPYGDGLFALPLACLWEMG